MQNLRKASGLVEETVPKTAGLFKPPEFESLAFRQIPRHTFGGVVQLVGQRCAKPPGFAACVRSTRTASVKKMMSDECRVMN